VTAIFHDSIYRLATIDALSVSSDVTFTFLSFIIDAVVLLLCCFFVGVPKPFLGHQALEELQKNSVSELFF
jgi:hypothetical protein